MPPLDGDAAGRRRPLDVVAVLVAQHRGECRLTRRRPPDERVAQGVLVALDEVEEASPLVRAQP